MYTLVPSHDHTRSSKCSHFSICAVVLLLRTYGSRFPFVVLIEPQTQEKVVMADTDRPLVCGMLHMSKKCVT